MMKSFFLFLLVLSSVSLSASIESDLGVYSFAQGDMQYAEVYTRVLGSSLEWIGEEGSKSSAADLLFIVREIGGDTIYAERVQLTSNDYKDLSDLIDIRRIVLNPGKYEALVEIGDANLLMSKQTMLFPFSIENTNGFNQSSLLINRNQKACLIDAANCKNGLAIEPLPWNISDESNSVIYLYNELTNVTALNTPFYIAYGLRKPSGETVATRYKKYETEDLIICNLPFDMSGIVSGDYNVFLEVYSSDKKLLSSKMLPILKINPTADLAVIETFNKDVKNSWVQGLSKEDLVFDLKSIWPLVGNHRTATLNQIIRSKKPRLQRHFLHTFWTEQGGSDPEASYLQYRKVAEAVDKRFYNTVGYGTETDRGYIYLKYGKPNDIIAVEDEPTAPPYQIWRYNYIAKTKQSNVKFIFYNQSLVSNDFTLLHSTCRLELQNPAWEVELYRRAPWDQEGNSIDARTVSDNFNRNARRYFDDL